MGRRDPAVNRPNSASTARSREAASKIALALGLAVVISLALAVSMAAIARADVPDTRFCTADSDLVASPGGGFAYVVTLRDNANAPVANATVVLDFTSAPGVTLCTDQDADSDRRLLMLTNVAGVATFYVKAGGSTAGYVTVGTAIDVIRHAHFVTTDFNGNMSVDTTDRSTLAALVGDPGPVGDLDKNGVVNAADQALFEARFGNNCTTTGATMMTWGRVKSLFR
jgi:hypothetical protein